MKIKIGSIVLAVMFLCSLAAESSAITRRTDLDDSEYTTLASTEAAYGGMILSSAGWYGSGVLISENWVLTAGHCVANWDTAPLTFTVSGVTRSVEAAYVSSYGDIAVAKLADPITTVTTAKLYDTAYGTEASRAGEAVMISGCGNTGTGDSGQVDGSGGTARAAYGTYLYLGSQWGWSDTLQLYRFGWGDVGEYTQGGGCCQGDSGGGMYYNVDGEWAVAGVLTTSWYDDGQVIGQYATGGCYVRSAPINDWILSYATDAQLIPEPMTVCLLGAGFVALLRKRKK